jgi:putative spermidine/putrescine transport system ATP-binding protein
MADRIAIFNNGKIVQDGSPADVYERPRSRFVADFVGSSNVMSPAFSLAHGGPSSWASIRPEKIRILSAGEKAPSGHGSAEGVVSAVHYQGAVSRVVIMVEDTRLSAAIPAQGEHFTEGQRALFIWPQASVTAMDAE